MKYSDNYGFSLPNKADKDSADIDVISENFEEIDKLLKECVVKNQGSDNVGKILVVGADGNLTLAEMPEDGNGVAY